MIQQVDDFRAEAAELHQLLNGLSDSDWTRATQFKAWTIDDIVRHLHMGDRMALASATCLDVTVLRPRWRISWRPRASKPL